MASIEIERLDTSDLIPQSKPVYHDIFSLLPLYEKLAFKTNVILTGLKGSGKSTSVSYFAAQSKIPILTFDCSEDVRRSHLIGMYILRGDKTPFVLGPLTTAFEVANEHGACILNFEEINSLSPAVQKMLNAVTDFRRKIEVPEAKKVFRLREGAKLWIVGTMNTIAYGGTYALNEDLKSRFLLVPLEYPKRDAEKEVVQVVFSKREKKLDSKLVDRVLTLAQETRQQSFDYALSTRDIIQLLECMDAVGLEKALWILTGKFEEGDRETIKKRIESIFGVLIGGGHG